jgi:hypothetical protein
MFALADREVLNDLRFTLRVMEESSHLGLDDQAADKLRQILLHQIARAERVLARKPGGSPNAAATLDEAP